MKICFLAASNSIHSYRWVKFFSDAGHEVTWISLAPTIFESLPGVSYHELGLAPFPFGLFRAVAHIRKILEVQQPDVMHVHSVGTYGLVALLSGFKPLVSTAWGSDVLFGRNSPVKRLFIKAVLKRSAVITCDAQHMVDAIAGLGITGDNVHIINFGIDTQKFYRRECRDDIRADFDLGQAPVVISLRNFEPVYDIATLLRAIPSVLELHPDARFMIVGRGTLENELKALAAELGVESAVRFVGFIPNHELPDYLSTMDVYVSTSLSDAGIAASTAEAMACGVPVVITNSGENSSWIDDGETGFLVPVSDPGKLAKGIIRLLDAPELREQIGIAGQKVIAERNDYYREMAKMDTLYRKAVPQRRG